jgi:hypothetical protein
MARQAHEVNVNIRFKKTRNWLLKPRGLINENLTGVCKDSSSLNMNESEIISF